MQRGIYEEENAHYIGKFGKAPENYALCQLCHGLSLVAFSTVFFLFLYNIRKYANQPV